MTIDVTNRWVNAHEQITHKTSMVYKYAFIEICY